LPVQVFVVFGQEAAVLANEFAVEPDFADVLSLSSTRGGFGPCPITMNRCAGQRGADEKVKDDSSRFDYSAAHIAESLKRAR
jgi:hypothetical protein